MEMPVNTLSQPDTPFISRKKLLRTDTNINQTQSVTITGEREVKTHIHIDKLLLDACLLLLAVRKRPLLCFYRSRVLCEREDTREIYTRTCYCIYCNIDPHVLSVYSLLTFSGYLLCRR